MLPASPFKSVGGISQKAVETVSYKICLMDECCIMLFVEDMVRELSNCEKTDYLKILLEDWHNSV